MIFYKYTNVKKQYVNKGLMIDTIAFILYFRHISYHQWSLSIKTVRNIPLNFLIFVKNIKIYIDKKT